MFHVCKVLHELSCSSPAGCGDVFQWSRLTSRAAHRPTPTHGGVMGMLSVIWGYFPVTDSIIIQNVYIQYSFICIVHFDSLFLYLMSLLCVFLINQMYSYSYTQFNNLNNYIFNSDCQWFKDSLLLCAGGSAIWEESEFCISVCRRPHVFPQGQTHHPQPGPVPHTGGALLRRYRAPMPLNIHNIQWLGVQLVS